MAVEPLRKDDVLAQAAIARGEGRSQATIVEQSRAIAEVQGALLVADRRPRDKAAALAEALESCRQTEVAQTAFFKFPRAGGAVQGESIHLARELARCWGNIIYAVVELDRDDARGMSEMMSYAWDLQTNTRSQTQFLVPHVRDKRGGGERLTEMRDIYENNANMGARRVRECIFAVLPPYLVQACADECRKTLEVGGGVPLPIRINQAIESFESALGIKRDRLEARMGPSSDWTAADIADLEISFKSIRRKEIDADTIFPKVGKLTANMLMSDDDTKSPRQSSNDATGDGPSGQESDGQEASDQSQAGEAVTLASALDEIKRAELVADVNSRVSALQPLLSDADAEELRSAAMDRIAELKAK